MKKCLVFVLCCCLFTGCGKKEVEPEIVYTSYTANINVDMGYTLDDISYTVVSDLNLEACDEVKHYTGVVKTYYKEEVIIEEIDRYISTNGVLYDKIDDEWYYSDAVIGGIVVPDQVELESKITDKALVADTGVITQYNAIIDSGEISSMLLGMTSTSTGTPCNIKIQYNGDMLYGLLVDFGSSAEGVDNYSVKLENIWYGTESYKVPNEVLGVAKHLTELPLSMEEEEEIYTEQAEQINTVANDTMRGKGYELDLIYSDEVNNYIEKYLNSYSPEELKSYLTYYDLEPIASKVALYIITTEIADFEDSRLEYTDEIANYLGTGEERNGN